MTESSQKQLMPLRLLRDLVLFALIVGIMYWVLFVKRNQYDLSKPFVLPRGSVPFNRSESEICKDLENSYQPKADPQKNGFRDIVQLFGKKFFHGISNDHWIFLCQKLELNPDDPPQVEFVPLIDFLCDRLEKDAGKSPKIQNDGSRAFDEEIQKEAFRIAVIEENKSETQRFDLIEQWLNTMDDAFPILTEALRKPIYFVPPLITEGCADLVAGAIAQRELSRILNYHVRIQISKHEMKSAWDGILLLYQLARHQYQQPFFNSILFGDIFESLTNTLAVEILKAGTFTPDELRQCLADLNLLPSREGFKDKLETERFSLLQCIVMFPQKGYAAFRTELLDESSYPESMNAGIKIQNAIIMEWIWIYRLLPFDWNIVAEVLNAEFDELQGKPGKQELFRSNMKLRKIYEEPLQSLYSFKNFKAMSREVRSVKLGKIFTVNYLPVRDQYDLIFAKGKTSFVLTQTAFALELYKKEKGNYPDSLVLLAEEKYLSEIPIDPYLRTEPAPLIYRTESDGFVLYSVGVNRQDDNGNPDDNCLQMLIPSEP